MSHPHITLGQIRTLAAQKTYSRGESLYLNKAISETALRGNVIEGTCEASSQTEPYQVQATITDEGIIDFSCNCLYDFGGACKHVVALLLTYLNAPNGFEERAPIVDVLENRDKPELIALIRQMVKRHPDLKTLIDRPVPGKATGELVVDTKAYRKELRQALRSQRQEWGAPGAETAVDSIAEAAQAFSLADDWHSASIIYRMIIEECLAKVDYFYDDEEGEYGYAIDQVIVSLGECLDHLEEDTTEHQAVINCLMDFYLTDIDTGGDVGADIPDVVIQHIHRDEIADLRTRVTTAKQQIKNDLYSEWAVEAYNKFLADLDLLDNVDPEAVLTRLRDEGMYSLLISKLIELKRVDEAIGIIHEYMPAPYERLQELARLVMAGYKDEAIQLAEEALKKNKDAELIAWLIYTLQIKGDTEGAFRWQIEQMKAEPDIAHYNELKVSAEKLGNWTLVRPEIIEQLENGKHYGVLTRVYLLDEDWDKAWKFLPKALETKNLMYTPNYQLEMDVAEATLQTHPEKALPVYIRYAYAAIDRCTRESYQEAAAYLVHIRDTYDSIDEFEVWEKLITGIRNQQPRLPALLDELKKAGL